MQSTRIRRQNRLSLKVTCTTTEGSTGGWTTADEVKKVAADNVKSAPSAVLASSVAPGSPQSSRVIVDAAAIKQA